MSKLNFYWEAIYTNGKTLKQFNDDGTENLFRDIQLDILKLFVLKSDTSDIQYSVDVENGQIWINSQKISFSDYMCRLIYFRRVKQPFNLISLGTRITIHCFGLQTTINNRNLQFILGVNDENGEVCFITK